MDNNKLTVLQEIGYEILPCCGTCEAGRFSSKASDFGTCVLHEYEHQKHTGPARELSVFRYGSCSKYCEDASAMKNVNGTKWERFVLPRRILSGGK